LHHKPPAWGLSCSAAARHALTDGLDARVWRLTHPLPGRFALGAGKKLPPASLGSVGAATRLDAAHVNRLPLARLGPLGRAHRRVLRAAWRLPRRDAAAPHQLAALAEKYKTRAYTQSGGEGSIPRGHRHRAKRETWAQRRVAQLEARRGWVQSTPKSSCAAANSLDRSA
jgi:hypothetical protein